VAESHSGPSLNATVRATHGRSQMQSSLSQNGYGLVVVVVVVVAAAAAAVGLGSDGGGSSGLWWWLVVLWGLRLDRRRHIGPEVGALLGVREGT